MRKFPVYALRWQLSTPILWPIMHWLGSGFWTIVLANVVGAGIFYFVDKHIFGCGTREWEVADAGIEEAA